MTTRKTILTTIFAFIFGMLGSFLIHFYFFYKQRYFFEEYAADQEIIPIVKQESSEIYAINIDDIKITLPPRHKVFSPALSADDVEKDLIRIGFSKNTPMVFRDEKYCYTSYKWFDSYSTWWIDFLKSNHISFVQDGFDCDNFSDLFMVLYNLSSMNSDKREKAQLVCGTLVVENLQEFAGIPAQKDSWHSLNIVWTDFGWFVIEPQNGIFISLRNYPNKNNIKAIIF